MVGPYDIGQYSDFIAIVILRQSRQDAIQYLRRDIRFDNELQSGQPSHQSLITGELAEFDLPQIMQHVAERTHEELQALRGIDHLEERSRYRPSLSAMVEDQRYDRRQGTKAAALAPGMAIPDPELVAEQLQRRAQLRGRFVFDQDIDQRRLAVLQIHLEEPVGLAAAQGFIDETAIDQPG